MVKRTCCSVLLRDGSYCEVKDFILFHCWGWQISRQGGPFSTVGYSYFSFVVKINHTFFSLIIIIGLYVSVPALFFLHIFIFLTFSNWGEYRFFIDSTSSDFGGIWLVQALFSGWCRYNKCTNQCTEDCW